MRLPVASVKIGRLLIYQLLEGVEEETIDVGNPTLLCSG